MFFGFVICVVCEWIWDENEWGWVIFYVVYRILLCSFCFIIVIYRIRWEMKGR